MKKIVLALALAVATAAAANAQTAAKQPAASKQAASKATKPAAMKEAQAKAPKAAAAKAMSTKGEVVSADATAKTITVKDSSGNSTTYTATGAAVASLAKLSAGDHVTVWHSDTNATKIVKAKAPAAKKAPKASK